MTGQDPGASSPVQYQQQHICSTTSRIYLLECQGRGYGPRGGGGSVFGGKGVSQFRNESLQSLLSPLSLRGGWQLLLTHFAEDTREARREQRGQTVTPRLPFHPWPAWSAAPYTLRSCFNLHNIPWKVLHPSYKRKPRPAEVVLVLKVEPFIRSQVSGESSGWESGLSFQPPCPKSWALPGGRLAWPRRQAPQAP